MNFKPTMAACGRMFGVGCVGLLLSLVCFRLQFNLSSATSVHLFLVALTALRFGLLEASALSVISAGCLDFFFTEPVFHLSMYDSRNWVALMTFEAAALLIATLSDRAIARARESELHQDQLHRMYELSQSILLLERNGPIGLQLAELIRSTLQVDGVAVWSAAEPAISTSGGCSLNDAGVRSLYFDEMNCDESRMSCRVLRLGTRPIGALVLEGHALSITSVNAVATLVSIAMEKAQAFHREASALAAKQSEQLRSAILDGLAHSFKSPLTAIISSSSGLLAMNTLSGAEHSLVTLIDQQAESLSALTNHLLLTAKLDMEHVTLHKRMVDLREYLRTTLQASLPALNGRAMTFALGQSGNTLVEIDEKLMELALTQVLDNAVKYGSPHTPVSIVLKEASDFVSIAIRNEGSYVPEDERERVFERFYRCRASEGKVSGTGIGLAVVKRIVEAHRGQATVESDREAGTTFTLALPRSIVGTP